MGTRKVVIVKENRRGVQEKSSLSNRNEDGYREKRVFVKENRRLVQGKSSLPERNVEREVQENSSLTKRSVEE